MRHWIVFVCFALMLAAATAGADITPQPDRGPPQGSAGGLNFAVEWIEVTVGPANGPRYQKRRQVVVLAGCTEGEANCQLARSRHLIGMEVHAVDGVNLQPEKGMIRQLIDAFARQTADPTVTIELFSRASQDAPIKVAFARR